MIQSGFAAWILEMVLPNERFVARRQALLPEPADWRGALDREQTMKRARCDVVCGRDRFNGHARIVEIGEHKALHLIEPAAICGTLIHRARNLDLECGCENVERRGADAVGDSSNATSKSTI